MFVEDEGDVEAGEDGEEVDEEDLISDFGKLNFPESKKKRKKNKISEENVLVVAKKSKKIKKNTRVPCKKSQKLLKF